MKLTKTKLKQIIKEELQSVLNEEDTSWWEDAWRAATAQSNRDYVEGPADKLTGMLSTAGRKAELADDQSKMMAAAGIAALLSMNPAFVKGLGSKALAQWAGVIPKELGIVMQAMISMLGTTELDKVTKPEEPVPADVEH